MKKYIFFTMVELLTVITIISILISLLLPSLNKAKEKAQAIYCLNNLKNTGMGGFLMYAADYNNIVYVHNGNASWSGIMIGFDPLSLKPTKEILQSGNPARLGYLKNVRTTRCPSLENQANTPARHFYGGPNPHLLGYFHSSDALYKMPSPYDVPPWFFAIKKVAKPSYSFGLADSMYLNNGKPGQHSVIKLDTSTTTSTYGGIHLRHQNSANVWFWDGHASGSKRSDFTKMAQSIRSGNSFMYLFSQNFAPLITNTK